MKGKKEKVEKAVSRKHIFKIIFKPSNYVLWLVLSSRKKRYYLVVPNIFCTCYSFLINVLLREKNAECYHISAQRMAAETNEYVYVEYEDKHFLKILNKALKIYEEEAVKDSLV